MSENYKIRWLKEPAKHDYSAALAYLSLIYDEKTAAAYVNKLKRAPVSEFKAKDIFRASGLSLLEISDGEVKKYKRKIKSESKLPPLLLVRDSANGKVVIADGYHRLCAAYSYIEDADISCKII